MEAEVVTDFLRRHCSRLALSWEDDASPILGDRGETLICALADWLDGKIDCAEPEFARLVESPALQRLGYANGLAAVTAELSRMRVVIAREMLGVNAIDDDAMIRVHAAIDRAIAVAVAHFAEAREAARDRFIAILGHDLRDPLKAVILTAHMLGHHPRLRERAARIDAACSRMMRLVGDVLDFARCHLGEGIPAQPDDRDLGELVREAVEELRATTRGRPIAVDLRGDLHVEVDRDRAMQALSNLVSNAIDHGTGPIELVVRETSDRRAVVTEITSHGAPIPERVLDRIFDPFARVDPTGPRSGLGLGLYIVEQIARAHGATCSVTSTTEGTMFAIRWPRAHLVEHAA